MLYHNPSGSVSLLTPSAPSSDPVLCFTPANNNNTAPRQEMVLCNNDSNLWLAYKVQSNAQKKYAVTPTSGLLPPGGDRKVQITVALKQGKGHTTQGDKMLVRCVGVEVTSDSSSADGDEETTLSYDPALWKKAPKQTMLKLFVPCVVGLEHEGGEGIDQERKNTKKPPPPPQLALSKLMQTSRAHCARLHRPRTHPSQNRVSGLRAVWYVKKRKK